MKRISIIIVLILILSACSMEGETVASQLPYPPNTMAAVATSEIAPTSILTEEGKRTAVFTGGYAHFPADKVEAALPIDFSISGVAEYEGELYGTAQYEYNDGNISISFGEGFLDYHKKDYEIIKNLYSSAIARRSVAEYVNPYLESKDFDFMTAEEAIAVAQDFLTKLGISAVVKTVYYMDYVDMQAEDDAFDKLAQGVDMPWGEEMGEWSEANNCYFIEFKESFDRIGIDRNTRRLGSSISYIGGTGIDICVNKDGILGTDIYAACDVLETEEPQEIVSEEEAIHTWQANADLIITDSKAEMTECKLVYIANLIDQEYKTPYRYTPAWRIESYTLFPRGDGTLARIFEYAYFDAYTGKEIV